MEEAILLAENEAEELKAKAEDPRALDDHVVLTQAYEQLGEAQRRDEMLYARWTELEAMQQSVAQA